MITENEARMVRHELESLGKDWVLVRWKSWQPGVGLIPGHNQWNVVAGGYELPSHTTIESLLALGYRVEVV